MWDWIVQNKEWVFSGFGVAIITAIIGIIIGKKKSIRQKQKSGDNSTNYQAAGDIKIGKESKDDDKN